MMNGTMSLKNNKVSTIKYLVTARAPNSTVANNEAHA